VDAYVLTDLKVELLHATKSWKIARMIKMKANEEQQKHPKARKRKKVYPAQLPSC
jgi:hypothetical protein